MKNKKTALGREEAAQKLIEKLGRYENRDSCVVSTSRDGLALASQVAKALGADLFFIPGEIVRHPGDRLRTLGVVTPEYSMLYDVDRDIPQDFVYRKTRTLQSKLNHRYRNVYNPIAHRFHSRTVILVEECLKTADKVLACVNTIREQDPAKIVIAVPVVSSRVVHDLIAEGDSVIFLNILPDKEVKRACHNFDPISDEDIAGLVDTSVDATV